MIFDQMGSLIAHPDFAEFVSSALTDPGQSELPNIDRIKSGIVASVLRKASNVDVNEGTVRDDEGRNYLFRLTKFTLGEGYSAAYCSGGSGRFRSERPETAAHGTDPRDRCECGLHSNGLDIRQPYDTFVECHYLAGTKTPKSCRAGPAPVTSHIAEIYELGNTVNLAQRAIWSFAHFIPKEIVRRVLDNSISTSLGGVKQEITLVFTDVQGFTTIAEFADPDVLMRQTSRYFSVLTEAFLAEGGTIDKFIGDAVMVFWNAPDPQPDHVARACRAALAAQAAGERLNAEFEAEDLKPFITRFGIHVGEAVVGNVGSSERMNYTALGNAVNLAARLEGLNKVVGTTILVSEDVYLRVRDQFEFSAFDAVVAKGMSRETGFTALSEYPHDIGLDAARSAFGAARFVGARGSRR